jgi:enoyl-CoA hydratase/carnithine racemase
VILSGEVYSAEDLYELGAIDVLAPDGQGIDAVYAHVGRRGRRHACHCVIRQARRIVNPVTREEMIRIADLWVDAALALSEADLRKMTRPSPPPKTAAATAASPRVKSQKTRGHSLSAAGAGGPRHGAPGDEGTATLPQPATT